MSALVYQYTNQLTVVECCNCHMDFAMPQDLYKRLRDHPGRSFYCPSGHAQHFTGESEETKLRRQLEWARESRDAARDLAAREARRRAAAQGQVTKIKRRVSKGVCPCCNRSFADLRRHMEGQHPDFTETHGAPGPV